MKNGTTLGLDFGAEKVASGAKEMQVIPGVFASVHMLRKSETGEAMEPLEIRGYGLLGKVRRESVELRLELPNGAPATSLVVFTIDGDRNILLSEPEEEGQKYTTTIPVIRRGSAVWTESKSNYCMFATFSPKGFVSVHVVLLRAEDGEFYLIHQQTHQVQAYRSEGRVVCPELDRKYAGWNQLEVLVAEHYAKNMELPPIEKFRAVRWDTSSLADNQIVVTVWSGRRGAGGGVNNKNEGCSVYWKDIERPQEIAPRVVHIGEIVTFTRLEVPKRYTQFQWDARGIRRIGEFAKQVADTVDVFADSSKAQRQEPVS